jgi:hypothetical protein
MGRRGFERERRKSRGLKELMGVRRFGETVEKCGKADGLCSKREFPFGVTAQLVACDSHRRIGKAVGYSWETQRWMGLVGDGRIG